MLLAARLRSQLLTGPPATNPVAVARHLLAVQGQDPRGARLAVRARSRGLSAADVDRALSEDRSLVITWLNRGTLQLIAVEDYWWLQALTTPPLHTAVHRRLDQEGVSPAQIDRGVGEIARAVAAEGPLTRAQLAERVERIGVPTARQALIHLLFAAAIRGHVVRGPMVGRQHAYVDVADWLGADVRARVAGCDRDVALAELARRYLIGHGPADDRELARWAGLPLRDARAGLTAIAGELRQRADGLFELASTPRSSRTLPPPRLLGAFDPLLIGWRDRSFCTGSHDAGLIRGGMFRPSLTVGGRVVGAWGLSGRELQLELFEEIGDDARAGLDRDVEAVRSYLGVSP